MLIVKIVSGTYGYRNGKRIEPKDRNSNPFELPDDEAHRLVTLGVAEIVNTRVATPDNDDLETMAGGNMSKGENGENGEENATEETAVFDEAYLYDMTNAELKDLAANLGINTSRCKVKKDYIDAIMENEAKEQRGNPPDISTEDPII